MKPIRSANELERCVSGKQLAHPCWKMPPVGTFKINTDAALNIQEKISSIGVVIRDSSGMVMASLCRNFGICYQPQIAEALGILRGLQLALKTGLVPASIESDALSMVNAICLKEVPNKEVGVVVNDILCVLRNSNLSSVNFVPRLANKAADSLAKLALAHVGEFVWIEDLSLVGGESGFG